jgi:hypothetical protein
MAGGLVEAQQAVVLHDDALRQGCAERVEVHIVLAVVVQEAEHRVAADVTERVTAGRGPGPAVEEGERTALEHRVLEGRPGLDAAYVEVEVALVAPVSELVADLPAAVALEQRAARGY